MMGVFDFCPISKFIFYFQAGAFILFNLILPTISRSHSILYWIDSVYLFQNKMITLPVLFIIFKTRYNERALGSKKFLTFSCLSFLMTTFIGMIFIKSDFFYLKSMKHAINLSMHSILFANVFYYLRYFPGNFIENITHRPRDKLWLLIMAIASVLCSIQRKKLPIFISAIVGYIFALIYNRNVFGIQKWNFFKKFSYLFDVFEKFMGTKPSEHWYNARKPHNIESSRSINASISESDINTLTMLGFERNEVLTALRLNDYNLEQASNYLLDSLNN